VVSKVEELVDPVLHANGSQSIALIGRPQISIQISILYKVCTVDLASYALCEFYAFRKSTTLLLISTLRGFDSRRLHHTSFTISNLMEYGDGRFPPRHPLC
jgi:hypothetical protein